MNVAICLFVVAILVVVRLPALPVVAPLFIGLPLALFGLSFTRTLPVSAFFLGLLFVLFVAETRIGASLPGPLQSRNLQVIGQVASLPERRDGIARFRFRLEATSSCDSDWTGLIAVSWYHAPARIRPGDRLRFTLRLTKPGASLNPGLFDYEGWLFAKGISARGYVKDSEDFELLESDALVMPHHTLRYRLRQIMRDMLKESPVKGLLIALTIGETGQISRSAWNSLTRTGTNHLLIISGLHVGLVAATIFRVFRLAPFSIRWAGLLTMLLAGSYSALAGFGLPVQRALIMTSVVLLAMCIDRKVSTLSMFTLSLLGVILLQPFAVMNTGFWLSFSAVFSLLYAFSGRSGNYRRHALRAILLAGIRTQWVVSVAMFPLLLYLLFQVSLLSFLANLVAIPWVSLMVIPWLLVFVLTAPLSQVISGASLSFAEFSLSILWRGIEWVAAQNWMFHGAPGVLPVLIAMFGILIVFCPRGLVPRWPGWMCFLPLLVIPAAPEKGVMRLTYIDVGQGLSVLLQTRNSALLYDAGPRFGDRFDSGEQIITPLLRQFGVNRLHSLIISHGDNDHAGGMQAILRNFDVGRVVSSVPGSEQNCESDREWSVDGVSFQIFGLPGGSGNNSSCMLLAYTADYGVLITGDIEKTAEDSLLKRELPGIHVISVPHHGSRTSSSPGFINHISPELAIVSAGVNNRFNHPEPAVLRRYEKRHVRVLNTAGEGAITIWLGKAGIERIERTRQKARRFWHRGQ
jgi:competence protein ComEC